MANSPKDTKKFVDFITRAEIYSDVKERLSSAENYLMLRRITLDKSEEPRMFFELDLSTSEMDWISKQLGEGIRNWRQSGRDLQTELKDHPRLMVAALVNAGSRASRENLFWPIYWELLGISRSLELEEFIRTQLKDWLRRFRLESFSEANLGNSKYVTRATLHAGIPTSELEVLVEDSLELFSGHGRDLAEQVAGNLLAKKYTDGQRPRTLFRLSLYKTKIAGRLFKSVYSVVRDFRSDADFHTNSRQSFDYDLPKSTFSELQRLLIERTEIGSPNKPTFEINDELQPHFKLDPDSGTVEVVLPAAPENTEDLVWEIKMGQDVFLVEPDIDFTRGQFKRESLTIHSPVQQIVIKSSQIIEPITLPFVSPEFPIALFQNDLFYKLDQESISNDRLFVLAPHATTFNDADNPTASKIVEEFHFNSWPGWSVFELANLKSCHGLRITLDRSIEASLRSITLKIRNPNTQEAGWFLDSGKVPDAFGSDFGSIYFESPQLIIPSDDSKWDLRLTYIDPEGTSYPIPGYENLQEFAGTPFPIFYDNAQNAWVGRFLVELLKNGSVKTQKIFNIAEGLQLELDYGKHRTFRSPDIDVTRNAYSKAFYEVDSDPAKRIKFPFTRSGTQSIPNNEDTDNITVSSLDGYQLELFISPKTLSFSVDELEAPPSWSSFPRFIQLQDLDSSGDLKVRFPHRIEGTVTLFVSQTKSDEVPLYVPMQERRNRTVFVTRISEILHAAENTDVSLTISIGWHRLTAIETWKAYSQSKRVNSDSGLNLKDFDDFKNHYDRFDSSLSPHGATLFQTGTNIFEGTASLHGNQLQLRGTVLGKGSVTGNLWPLTHPNQAPERVIFSPSLSTEVPESLVNAGPLALEVSLESGDQKSRQVQFPSSKSIYLAQSGYSKQDDGLWNLAFKLSEYDSNLAPAHAATVSPEEYPALWDRLFALRHFSFKSPQAVSFLSHLLQLCGRTFQLDPRQSLKALSNSNVRIQYQIGLAIQFGLLDHPFLALDDISNKTHSDSWVGILEQFSIAKKIASDPDHPNKQVHFNQTITLIRSSGGDELASILRGESNFDTKKVISLMDKIGPMAFFRAHDELVDTLTDIDGRRLLADETALKHGWSELLRNQSRINQIAEFQGLREEAIKAYSTQVPKRLEEYSSLLKRFAENFSDNTTNLWVWAPFISSVLSYTTRKRSIRREDALGTIQSHNWEIHRPWAEFAYICPTLATYDLLMAEATILSEQLDS